MRRRSFDYGTAKGLDCRDSLLPGSWRSGIRASNYVKYYVIFSLLLSVPLASMLALDAESATRKYAFSAGYPTGKLGYFLRTGGLTQYHAAATAIGDVLVDVPPGAYVQLNVNPHCLERPEKLKSMPTDGIDDLRIEYMSMDESVTVCDKALAAFPLFKNPLYLNCFRTDVTDRGIVSFKSLEKVTRLMCFMSMLNGSVLTEYKRLHGLEQLILAHNSIKEDYLVNLKELQNLRYLNLDETNLSDSGLQEVCKIKKLNQLSIALNSRLTDKGLQILAHCPDLFTLNLSYDKNISDDSIPTLQKLNKLSFLDLTKTKITAAGLEKLKNLKLLRLYIPQEYSVRDMVALQKTFPSAIILHGKPVSDDIQTQFAPLK